jgi:FkbM family methyltransferase
MANSEQYGSKSIEVKTGLLMAVQGVLLFEFDIGAAMDKCVSNMNTTQRRTLYSKFQRRWRSNQTGGFRVRALRWRILHWLLLQKFGFQLWVRAPMFWGGRMYVLTNETISKGILSFGYAESAITALMLRTVKPGMRVVDIGAHLGYEAMLASHLVGAGGRVVSFEPQPRIAWWTRRNLQPYSQCRVVESAVGDFNGIINLTDTELLYSAFASATEQSEGSIRVPITTLSDAITTGERPVNFVKCDVEGMEMSVLRGALDILGKDRPLLVLEGEMPGSDRPRIRELAAFLEPLGYSGLMFDFDGELQLGPLGTLDVGHANVAFVNRSNRTFGDLLPYIGS